MRLICASHHDRLAAARCVACGIHLCEGCRRKMGVRNYCDECCQERMKPLVAAALGRTPARPAPAPPPATPAPRTQPRSVDPKSPVFASALSLVPGLGQAYSGRWLRGFLFFGSAAFLSSAAVPALVACFLYVFNLFDAYRLAELHNDRIPEKRRPDAERRKDGVDDSLFTLAGLGVAAWTFFQGGGFQAGAGAVLPMAALVAGLLFAQQTRS